jgi:cysteine desulfurase
MFWKKFFKSNNKRIYFDWASAVPVLDVAKNAFLEAIENFANSSSIHEEGEKTKDILLDARKKIAKHIHARHENIFFTSSATEANNIFIKGVALNKEHSHIVYSKSDHSSIIEPVESLKKFGVSMTSIAPNKIGRLLVEDIVSAVKENTALICFSYVNSETGTIQDVRKIVLAVREHCAKNSWTVPKIFIDASQAIKYLQIDVSNLFVDGLSFGGSKLGSVPGASVLYVKNDTKLFPIISGGGQEEGVRSGTENLPAIVALAKTMEVVLDTKKQNEEREYLYDLRHYAIEKLGGIAEVFGDTKFKYNKYYENAAPHILLISIPDMLGEEALLRLDAKGISVSTASACSLLENSGSNFLKSIGEPVLAKETIRLSFSVDNTKKEIDYLVEKIKEIKKFSVQL